MLGHTLIKKKKKETKKPKKQTTMLPFDFPIFHICYLLGSCGGVFFFKVEMLKYL